MKSAFGVAQTLCLWAAPIAVTAATSVFTAPSQAATFARSESEVVFGNFSHLPDQFSTFTDTDTEAIAVSGMGKVVAEADAKADFVVDSGINFVTGETQGSGFDYRGDAFGIAQIASFFSVGSQETFSFDFLTFTDLASSIDDAEFETASAASLIQFELFDHTSGNLLDTFGVSGRVSSSGEAEMKLASSPNVSILPLQQEKSSQPKNSFAVGIFAGNYSRQFGSSVQLRLVETKANRATASAKPVPEPSEIAGTVVIGALLGYWRLKSNRARTSKE
jgi:hypothetical protein